MVTRHSASVDEIAAVQSVLLELANILHPFWDDIVVIGGMVPFLGIPQTASLHPGTVDIDLAIDHRKISGSSYRSMQEILLINLYQQDVKKPFRYYRAVKVHDRNITIPVDFLASEYYGTDSERDFEEIEEVHVLKIEGCEVAHLDSMTLHISGERPGGGLDEADIHLATIPQSIVMKGYALSRNEPKDAFDIYYMVKYFPGGIYALKKAFVPFLPHGGVVGGLTRIREKFRTVDHIGPFQVVKEMPQSGVPEMIRRDAYEQVAALLDGLGVG